MTVDEAFRFDDRRVVFLGHVTEGPEYLPAARCTLEIGGEVVQELTIEGEMIPSRTSDPRRSVSTTDIVNISLEALVGAVLRHLEPLDGDCET